MKRGLHNPPAALSVAADAANPAGAASGTCARPASRSAARRGLLAVLGAALLVAGPMVPRAAGQDPGAAGAESLDPAPSQVPAAEPDESESMEDLLAQPAPGTEPSSGWDAPPAAAAASPAAPAAPRAGAVPPSAADAAPATLPASTPEPAAAPEDEAAAETPPAGPAVEVLSFGEGSTTTWIVRHGDEWSMHAESVSASAIFEAWHQAGGPAMASKVSMDYPFTLSVHRMTTERLVARIVEGYGYTLHYDAAGRMELVRVYSQRPSFQYKTARLVESLATWKQVETAVPTAAAPADQGSR